MKTLSADETEAMTAYRLGTAAGEAIQERDAIIADLREDLSILKTTIPVLYDRLGRSREDGIKDWTAKRSGGGITVSGTAYRGGDPTQVHDIETIRTSPQGIVATTSDGVEFWLEG